VTIEGRFLAMLSAENVARLQGLAHPVRFPSGSRIFDEGRKADRFWVIRTGRVALDLHVPGRAAAVVETLVPGDLLGWSWLIAPHRTHFGARAETEVTADEFDAGTVRVLCQEDPLLGREVAMAVASVVATRLLSARTRLLDLYAPFGSGSER
jgi:CRP-like cAMP-binding protein